MTHTENHIERSRPIAFQIPVLIGAAIGFLVISFFVFGADNPPASWGKFWMIRPLIITPLAGATGGVFFYFMDYMRYKNGVNPTVAIVLSLVVGIIGLWLGIVLGLVGTMWN